MNFEQALSAYVGRTVELFSADSFFQGRLVGVASGIVSVDAASSVYAIPSGIVSVPIRQLEYARVMAP